MIALICFLSLSLMADTFVVTFKKELTPEELKAYEKLTASSMSKLYPGKTNSFLDRSYVVDNPEALPKEAIEKIEKSEKIYAQTIIPTTQERPTGDDLSHYQWGLVNQGQIARLDVDDISHRDIVGIPGMDSGVTTYWKKPLKEQVVAVIDSGVDLDHPDLQGSFAINEAECTPEGKLKPRPRKDMDGNGFKGDCMGWNFASRKKGGDHRSYDESGHGTHVAGVIAAVKDNEIGVAGAGGNVVKILPLKVMGRAAKESLSHRVAQAILYAIDRKVSIINLSMGWPSAAHADFLQEAINQAVAKGILIIAAAGNNGHQAPPYPCRLSEVLCVGSIDPNGKRSSFSNYGPRVNVYAPGQKILSTYPMKLSPRYFSIKGYEVKSGTSQATPFVSAQAALVWGQHPKWNARDVWSALTKKTIAQLPDVATLPEVSWKLEAPESAMALVKADGTFELQFDVLQRGFQKAKASIQVTPPSGVSFEQSHFEEEFAPHSKKTFTLKGTLSSLTRDNALILPVTVNETELVLHTTFSLDGKAPTKILKVDANPYGNLRTVQGSGKRPLYYSQKVEGKKIHLWFINYAGDVFTLELDGMAVFSVETLDANFDGVHDLWIRYRKDKSIIHAFFDLKGKALFGKTSYWRFVPETIFVNPSSVVVLPYRHRKYGLIPKFCSYQKGKIPQANQSDDPWEEPDMSVDYHAYCLIPKDEDGGISLETTIVDHPKWRENLRDQYHLSYKDAIDILGVTPVDNRLAVIYSYGRGFNRSYGLYKLAHGHQRLMTSGIHLDGYNLKWDPDHGVTWVGMIDTAKVQLVNMTGQMLWGSQIHTRQDPSDSILGHILSYSSQEGRHHFIQSKDALIHVSDNQTLERRVLRYSFLSNEQSTELFYPVKAQGQTALYVDATSIRTDFVYTLVPGRNSIEAPVALTLSIEKGCLGLNPRTIDGLLHYVVSCEDKSLRFYEVRIP